MLPYFPSVHVHGPFWQLQLLLKLSEHILSFDGRLGDGPVFDDPALQKNIVQNIALALTCLILLPRSDVPLQITPQPYVVPHHMSGPSWGKRGLVQSSRRWQTSQTKFWIYFCMEVAITMSHNAKKRLSHMKMEAIHGGVLYINGKTWWSIIRFVVCW